MSFEGIDIGLNETRRRKRGSAIPDFTGDIDLDKLSRGVPFPSSADFGRRATEQNILGQRGRVETTPLRIESEGGIEDAFLADPLSAPTIDPNRKSNGKRKKGKQNKRDKARASLLNENRRLARGGAPRNVEEQDIDVINDFSFRSLGV